MFVWILAGYLLAFTIWYYFWRREQFSKSLRKIFALIVEEWKLENPDGDIRDLRFILVYKDEQLEFGLEEEDKNSEC